MTISSASQPFLTGYLASPERGTTHELLIVPPKISPKSQTELWRMFHAIHRDELATMEFKTVPPPSDDL